MNDRSDFYGTVFGAALALTVPVAAVTMVGATIRDHTVSGSVTHHRQVTAFNEFWEALAYDSPLDNDELDGFRHFVAKRLEAPNPAHALVTTIIPDGQFTHVNDLLGVEAVHYPCLETDSRSGDCTTHDPTGLIGDKFALDALQAEPAFYRTLQRDVPPVKDDGLWSYTNGFIALGLLWVLALAFAVVADVVITVGESAQRRQQRRQDAARLSRMSPRERQVELLKRQVEAWPYGKERTAALKKVKEAEKAIAAERSVEDEARTGTVLTELDALVTDSTNWRQAYEEQL